MPPISYKPGSKPYEEKTFNELLVETAEESKGSLVHATIQAFKDGDSAAIKLVTQALLENQYKEENQFPITDEKFKQIITMAADWIKQSTV